MYLDAPVYIWGVQCIYMAYLTGGGGRRRHVRVHDRVCTCITTPDNNHHTKHTRIIVGWCVTAPDNNHHTKHTGMIVGCCSVAAHSPPCKIRHLYILCILQGGVSIYTQSSTNSSDRFASPRPCMCRNNRVSGPNISIQCMRL
jgi:hypothetical protein